MSFAFTNQELQSLEELKKSCDYQESLILPALWIVQRRQGFISNDNVSYLAKTLKLPAMSIMEVLSFFEMLEKKQNGKYHLKVCAGISCQLNGAQKNIDFLCKTLGIKLNETTPDGLFTLSLTQCLGYCDKAPAMLCNLDQHHSLDLEGLEMLLDKLRQGN